MQVAVGVSTALQYALAPYATTGRADAQPESLQFSGIYATHMRSEGSGCLPRLLMKRFALAAKQQPAGDPDPAGASRNGGQMPAIVAQIEKAQASGIDITTPISRVSRMVQLFLCLHSSLGVWDGGDVRAKLVERLKDPGNARAHCKRNVGDAFHRMGQRVAGDRWTRGDSGECMNLLPPLQGKTIADIAKLWNKDAFDNTSRPSDSGQRFTQVVPSSHGVARRGAALQQPWVSVDNDSQGTVPDARWARTSPSASLRNFSAHPAQR